MNLDEPEERSIAAGEYVLGTLDPAARRAFEQRLLADAPLQAEVYAWQDRLLPLGRRSAPQTPAPDTWKAIEARLRPPPAVSAVVGTQAAPANDALWQRLRRWRAFGALATAAALLLATLLVVRGIAPEPARYLAVLQAPQDQSAGWVVEITAGEQLRLLPLLAATGLPPGKALQFWTKAEGAAAPTSLGLVRPGEALALPVARLPAVEARQLFELTLEPETGSPIGRPTGPILFIGRTVRL